MFSIHCICNVDVDREKRMFNIFLIEKRKTYHPAERSINANNYKLIFSSNNHKNKFYCK